MVGSDSVDPGSIAGAGAQLGAAEDLGAVMGGITGSRTIVGEGSGAAAAEKGKKPKVRGNKRQKTEQIISTCTTGLQKRSGQRQ